MLEPRKISNAIHALAWIQGLYFFFTSVWPIVHMSSFLAVTGPKHDLWLVQVKTPEESKYPWDYYKVLATISGDDAFGPPNPECSLVKK